MCTIVRYTQDPVTLRVVAVCVLFGLLADSHISGIPAQLFERYLKREHLIDLLPRSDKQIMQKLFLDSTMKWEYVLNTEMDDVQDSSRSVLSKPS